MPGLSLETRYQLVRAAERAALARIRTEGRCLAVTPCDVAVLRVLAFDHHSSVTGRCDPGMRRIARLARVSLGTVQAAVHRLEAAGFLQIVRRQLLVLGRWLRWTHQYDLPPVAPCPVQRLAQNPKPKKKKAQERGAPAWQGTPEQARAALAAVRAARTRFPVKPVPTLRG